MSSVTIDLDEGLATLLHQTNEHVELAAIEMIALDLYRRGAISSGKAGGLLGMSRLDFIRHASQLGIPSIDMNADERAQEKAAVTAWLES